MGCLELLLTCTVQYPLEVMDILILLAVVSFLGVIVITQLPFLVESAT
jgi:hypothetical protein